MTLLIQLYIFVLAIICQVTLPAVVVSPKPSYMRTRVPTFVPTFVPTLTPSCKPTVSPTFTVTPGPTLPTSQPSSRPSNQPASHPSSKPSSQPSRRPSSQPSRQPTTNPTNPTGQPTRQPSGQPSRQPSSQPSRQPTSQPSRQPSRQPISRPTGQPTSVPTRPTPLPTLAPTSPTLKPTMRPSTPTSQPSRQPASHPSSHPSKQPSAHPTSQPSRQPTRQPTGQPSEQPSTQPSRQPSRQPTRQPTGQPSRQPSSQPSRQPFSRPSRQPSSQPSAHPSRQPSAQPSRQPSSNPTNPTGQPSRQPSSQPSRHPSRQPTCQPTSNPTNPTGQPTRQPTGQPSLQPTSHPSKPTSQPSSQPTRQPSSKPSSQPSRQPSRQPTRQPTTQPSSNPTNPTSQPTSQPSSPSSQPTSQPSNPTSQPSSNPTSVPTMFTLKVQQYAAVNKEAFDLFTPTWTSTHSTWIDIDPNQHFCEEASKVPSYPVCVDGYLIPDPFNYKARNKDKCMNVQCINRVEGTNCSYTPSDTVDYLPPLSDNTLDTEFICPFSDLMAHVVGASYGMEAGIPPLFTPITPVPLQIRGQVLAQSNDQCFGVPNAEIVAWQLNPLALNKFTVKGQHDHTLDYTLSGRPIPEYNTSDQTHLSSFSSLRELSCRGLKHSNDDGSFTWQTLIPPSYGPPRHIMFTVSAPGYQNITTRMYFDVDWRLQQLTTQNGDINSRNIDNADFQINLNRGTSRTDIHDTENAFPGQVAKDPRVAKLKFVTTIPNSLRYSAGYFETEFNFVLQPVRAQEIVYAKDRSVMPPMDIRGLWAEPSGGLIQVDTTGTSFIATQFPHPRSWGTVIGSIAGDVIRGVSFHQSISGASDKLAQGESYTPSVDLWNQGGGLSTGLVLPKDSFATASFTPTAPLAASIVWSGVDTDFTWSKYSGTALAGYRYIKLLINRETGGYPGGKLVLNEIQFFEGVLSQTQQPFFKMRTPRTPSPQMVSCSSFADQSSHCYRAFDGDASAGSAWITNPVGSFQRTLSTPQWVTFDFGKGHVIHPTAMKIVCDAGNPHTPKGCPMTFSLLGSQDNIKFDLINRQDLNEYNNEYADGGKMFYFVYETSAGRVNQQRCGSCDAGPKFMCHLDSYDGTCASRYCSAEGVCEATPLCPLGQYLDFQFTSYSTPAFTCKQCAPGRYGNVTGLTSSYCSGLCEEGYYCVAGSTSSRAQECGGAGLFCPQGSGAPVPASAGRKTKNHKKIRIVTPTQAPSMFPSRGPTLVPLFSVSPTSQTPSMIPSRIPTWSPSRVPTVMPSRSRAPTTRSPSATPTTRSPTMSPTTSSPSVIPTTAVPSSSFPPTVSPSVLPSFAPTAPTLSPTVYPTQRPSSGPTYAPTVFVEAPEFTYIDDVNSTATQSYESLCEVGHYCVRGTAIPCPVGTYGDREGLQTAKCAGDCFAGTYCPAGSVTPTVCEPGYYCPDGKERVICPAGTYGNSTGLKDRMCNGFCSVGHYCEAGSVSGENRPCPAGRYGSVSGLGNSLCSGLCSPGYYCTEGAPNATMYECGSNNLYCPEGSPSPVTVSRGYYSVGGTNKTRSAQLQVESGYYSNYGVKRSCPAGTFGSEGGLDFDLTVGQNPPTQQPTPVPTLKTSKGPTPNPSRVPTLYYPTKAPSCAPTVTPTFTKIPTVTRYPTSQPTSQPSRQPSRQPTTQPSRQPTTQPSRQPTSHPSATPTWNPTQPTGQPSRQPTSQPSMSPTNPTSKPSGQPSSAPTITQAPVMKVGTWQPTSQPSFAAFTSNPTYRPSNIGEAPVKNILCSGYCAKGHYCPSNSTSKNQIPCPAGRYGASEGLRDDRCTGICPLGHYCPPGTVRPIKCPPGVFGNTTGLVDAGCSTNCWAGGCKPNYCQEGFYCPAGSISGTQQGCGGVDKYCPAGSAAPVHVDRGYYTVGPHPEENEFTRTYQLICEPGFFCVGGVRSVCPRGNFGISFGLFNESCSGLCPMGHYCPEGSVNGTTLRCPAGRYGATKGLFDSSCSGLCTAGYYCREGSTSPTQLQCAVYSTEHLPQTTYIPANDGSYQSYLIDTNATTAIVTNTDIVTITLNNPNNVYCPLGSALPLVALPGYYTFGGNRTTRNSQQPCPMGTYCSEGKMHDCPGGSYGRAQRLTDSTCTGLCAKGHYCPPASINSRQHPCPAGYYGATEGLSTPLCSGSCIHPSNCTVGSTSDSSLTYAT